MITGQADWKTECLCRTVAKNGNLKPEINQGPLKAQVWMGLSQYEEALQVSPLLGVTGSKPVPMKIKVWALWLSSLSSLAPPVNPHSLAVPPERMHWGLPGGPVVKHPPANPGDTLGRPHMLRSSEARAPQLLSLQSLVPLRLRKEEPLLAAAREHPQEALKTQCSHK